MDDLDAILGATKQAYSPDPHAKQRVRRAVASAIAATATAGTTVTAEGAAHVAQQAAQAPGLGAVKTAAASKAATTASSWGAKLAVTLALVGVSAGGYVLSQPSAKPAPVEAKPVTQAVEEATDNAHAVVEPPATEPAAEAAEEPKAELPTVPQVVSQKPKPKSYRTSKKPHSAAPPAADSAPVAKASTLLAELKLLRRASAQLQQGQSAQALKTLAQHRAEYPKSVVSSERYGLTVLAQCSLSKNDKTKEQARRFLKRAPSSPLAAKIKERCLK